MIGRALPGPKDRIDTPACPASASATDGPRVSASSKLSRLVTELKESNVVAVPLAYPVTATFSCSAAMVSTKVSDADPPAVRVTV